MKLYYIAQEYKGQLKTNDYLAVTNSEEEAQRLLETIDGAKGIVVKEYTQAQLKPRRKRK